MRNILNLLVATATFALVLTVSGQESKKKSSGTAAKPKAAKAAPASAEAAKSASDQPLGGKLRQLKGVVFIGSLKELKAAGASSDEGVVINGPGFLAGHYQEVYKTVKPYLFKPLTESLLERLNIDLVRMCRKLDHPVVDVFYPEQEVTDAATIQIIIYEGKVGKITVVNEGEKYFSDDLVTSRIHVVEGGSISQKSVLADLDRMNRNPNFREVGVSYKQGAFKREQGGTTDIDFVVKDRFPLRGFAGYDNYGVKVLGEDRVFAGFNYGNVWGIDHQFNYQYTTDLSFKSLHSHSASYVAPLPWGGHTFAVFGDYNDVKADLSKIGFPGIANNGQVYQLSTRYTVPLPSFRSVNHDISVGFDLKNLNTSLLFNSLVVAPFKVDANQFTLEYRANRRDQVGYSQIVLSGFYSPGSLLGQNSDADFGTVRPGLKSEYFYGRVLVERGFDLPGGLRLVGKGGYQASSTALLPSEQLSLGGNSMVRGYPEHIVSDDRGWYGTGELHSPLFRLGDLTQQKVGDFLDVYGFFDYAAIHANGASSPSAILSSAGAGLSLRVSRNLLVNAAYGYQLRSLPIGTPAALTKDKGRAHIGATISF